MSNTLSEQNEQEIGIPQGSILTLSLFNIKTHNINKLKHWDRLRFICRWLPNMQPHKKIPDIIERLFQQSLNR